MGSRRIVAFVVAGMFLGIGGAAPVGSQQTQAPTFRTGTTLVELTIVAQDGKGNAVTDLTKDDLLLIDGQRPRDIAFFRFDGGTGPVRSAALPLPEGFATNHPET